MGHGFEFGGLRSRAGFAVICGHPRSGTTLLEQILDSHPQVVSAEETAIFFEAALSLRRKLPREAGMLENFESASPESLRQTRDWYLHAMQAFVGTPIGDRLLIDKNPSADRAGSRLGPRVSGDPLYCCPAIRGTCA